uniref:Uncharacterized protein n=1 Tax=Globodera pallida TaxID=36090 RepID=A0A183C006_GLOPA
MNVGDAANTSDFAELEQQKQSNAKFAEIERQNDLQQEKVIKLEKYQKEQQLNIVDLQKTIATMREIGIHLSFNIYKKIRIIMSEETSAVCGHF